jgi:hypothetical protein
VPRRLRPKTRRALAAATAALVAAVGLVVLVLAVAPDRDESRLGDPVFRVGRTDRLAAEIADRGPFLFADVSGSRDRPAYVQHLGGDEDEGWFAFLAVPDGAGVDCAVRWDTAAEEFVDPCSGDRYPADGEGLEQFEVIVEDGQVDVDLRPPDGP